MKAKYQMDIQSVIKMPQLKDNNHESIYRCYHILDTVLGMIERCDSKETIFAVVEFMNEYKTPTP